MIKITLCLNNDIQACQGGNAIEYHSILRRHEAGECVHQIEYHTNKQGSHYFRHFVLFSAILNFGDCDTTTGRWANTYAHG
jgi:hypothetical protein